MLFNVQTNKNNIQEAAEGMQKSAFLPTKIIQLSSDESRIISGSETRGWKIFLTE